MVVLEGGAAGLIGAVPGGMLFRKRLGSSIHGPTKVLPCCGCAKLAGDTDTMNEHLASARKHAEAITDADSKKMLEEDLNTIG